MVPCESFDVSDTSRIAEVRRVAAAMGTSAGLNEQECGKLSLVVTEAGTNLIKHAGSGEMILHPLHAGSFQGVQVLALDKGPGDPNIDKCLKDGYSKAGTSGNGLGAIIRMSRNFDIYSQPGVGTALCAEVWANDAPAGAARHMDIGSFCKSMTGESVCGDDASTHEDETRGLCLIIDGLGHGAFAQQAANTGTRLFEQYRQREPLETLDFIHKGMTATRGGCGSIAAMNWGSHTLKYCGIGNISAILASPGVRRNLVSMNGTLGQNPLKLKDFNYPWSENDLLIMHSDGMTANWNFDAYPGLMERRPALIAGVLYRDFCRRRDDFSIIVARLRSVAA